VDDNDIIDGLRGIALAEPDLGFDPDDVADRGARRRRDRRVALGTGLGVTAVAVAAVTFAVTFTNAGPLGAAAPPSGPTSTAPGPSPHDLSALAARNTAHLEDVVGRVLPNAREIKVGAFDQQYRDAEDGDWATMTAEVMFRDDAGPAAFTITIGGPQAAGDGPPLTCDPHAPAAADEPRLPNGKTLTCKNVPQADGSTVVLQQTGAVTSVDLEHIVLNGLDAAHGRTDGSEVNIVNDRLISVRVADEYGTDNYGDRPRDPLTEQQLIALVTDPGFTLG
jgi:hypothetical protein